MSESHALLLTSALGVPLFTLDATLFFRLMPRPWRRSLVAFVVLAL